VIGAAARALRNRAFLVEQIGVPGTAAHRISELLDGAKQIAAALDNGPTPARARLIHELLERVVVGDDALAITLRRAALSKTYTGDHNDPIHLTVPVQFRRRGVEMKVVIADDTDKPARPDPALIKSVVRAHLWFDDVATGRAISLQAVADREGITEGYVRRLIPLAFLAPHIVEAILEGEQPVDLTAARLTGGDINLPLNWIEQRQRL